MKMTAVTAAALLAAQPMMTRDADAGVETRNAPPATRQVRDAASSDVRTRRNRKARSRAKARP